MTLLLALVVGQLVEVPHALHDVQAVALSPDAHVVSVWTRAASDARCVRWSVQVVTGVTTREAEEPCRAMGFQHPARPVRAVTEAGEVRFFHVKSGALLGAWKHPGLRAAVPGGGVEWLVWLDDRFFLADGDELARTVGAPPVPPVLSLAFAPGVGWKKYVAPVGVCDPAGGVMISGDTLLLDVADDAKPLEVRVKTVSGVLRKWLVDAVSATPVDGLRIERAHFPSKKVRRLRVQFPEALEALHVGAVGARVPRLRPVAEPMRTSGWSADCAVEGDELRPARVLLAPSRK